MTWHRCRRWTENRMSCPFRHLGEPEEKPEVKKPLDRVRDWYVKDINISRRIGWKHGPPPEFVQRIYEFVNDSLALFERPEKLDAMDMGARFQLFIEKVIETGGPALKQEVSFPPLMQKSLFLGEDEPEPKPHRKAPKGAPIEEALTTMLGEERFGAWLPHKRDSPREAGSRDPGKAEGKYRPSSTAGTQQRPPRGGAGRPARAANPGVMQTNWTEIINQMTDLVGGQKQQRPETDRSA